jgi:hypothetical protein
MVCLLSFDMLCWRLAKGHTSMTRACHEQNEVNEQIIHIPLGMSCRTWWGHDQLAPQYVWYRHLQPCRGDHGEQVNHELFDL